MLFQKVSRESPGLSFLQGPPRCKLMTLSRPGQRQVLRLGENELRLAQVSTLPGQVTSEPLFQLPALYYNQDPLKVSFLTETRSTMKIRFLPSSYNSVLCSYAVDGTIFYAQCDNTTTLPVFHQEIQSKVLYKIAGIVSQRLKKRRKKGTFPTAFPVLNNTERDVFM